MMKVYNKAVLPKGFKAAGISCGIKKSAKPDLALFYSVSPAKAACLFTANKIQAAPVRVSKGFLSKKGLFRGIIVNSGNANCFTAKTGIEDAKKMASCAARQLNTKYGEILVASTGIIAKKLPVRLIERAMPGLARVLSSRGIAEAARAIFTTDNFTKEVTVKFNAGGKVITISGVAKGAGMIAPEMATMLVFIMTDACISQGALKKSLKQSADVSFNCITVDGCMSTNDSIMLLANAKAENKIISSGKKLEIFTDALKAACITLAKLIVKDAEGATKFISITVKGARNDKDARKAGLFIANSNLLKCAIYGENPNFGRVIAALGASGVDVKEEAIKLRTGSLKQRNVGIEVTVGRGKGSAVIYTSDLTPEYIKINAEYN